jgi:hypothetical protein
MEHVADPDPSDNTAGIFRLNVFNGLCSRWYPNRAGEEKNDETDFCTHTSPPETLLLKMLHDEAVLVVLFDVAGLVAITRS